MPAKRRLLPRRCPKCREIFGTVQVVYLTGKRKNEKFRHIFRNNFIFRIGHYDSEQYNEGKKRYDDPFNYEEEDVKKGRLRTSQRRWCSFRSDHLEFGNLFGDDLEREMRYELTHTDPVTKSINEKLWNRVMEEGWKVRWPEIPLKSHTHTRI